jgi:NAD(P)-dependent dehydrogenase (short-subunit alcohol dehydrogenase family)
VKIQNQILSEDERRTMLLQDKVAVVFGAAGALGSKIASVFSHEGASIFLSGRRLDPIEKLAKEIRIANGKADAAEVDALDEKAVTAYLDRVVEQAGRIDIVYNAVGPQAIEYDNVKPTMEVSYEKFLIPLNTYVASNFLTARAAARHMLRRHSGVILFVTGTPSRGIPQTSAIGAAMGAIEAMMRCFATEWSPSGVRVVCVRSGGMSDTRTIQQSIEIAARAMGITREQFAEQLKQSYLLRRQPVSDDTARIAAFMVTDHANTITGAIINATCGHVID